MTTLSFLKSAIFMTSSVYEDEEIVTIDFYTHILKKRERMRNKRKRAEGFEERKT